MPTPRRWADRWGQAHRKKDHHPISLPFWHLNKFQCNVNEIWFLVEWAVENTQFTNPVLSLVLETYYNCELSRRWKNGSGVSRVQTQTDNIQAASGSAEFSYSVSRVSKWTSCHGDNWSPSWTAIAKHLDNTIHRVTKQHTFETLQLSAFYMSVIKVKVHALKVTTAWVWLISSILI